MFLDWLKSIFKIVETYPKWLTIAFKDIGVVEINGKSHNKRILEFHNNTTLRAKDDETPWCASAMSTWLKEAGELYTKSARARSYEHYGYKLNGPKIGCIAVFWRQTPDCGKGHVGFYIGEVRDQILVLGGNQEDAVTIKEYPKKRLLGYRWPTGVKE